VIAVTLNFSGSAHIASTNGRDKTQTST